MKGREKRWADLEEFFTKVLLYESYNNECSRAISFDITSVLEDATALLAAAEDIMGGKEMDHEELMLLIQMLFDKEDNLVKGREILVERAYRPWAD